MLAVFFSGAANVSVNTEAGSLAGDSLGFSWICNVDWIFEIIKSVYQPVSITASNQSLFTTRLQSSISVALQGWSWSMCKHKHVLMYITNYVCIVFTFSRFTSPHLQSQILKSRNAVDSPLWATETDNIRAYRKLSVMQEQSNLTLFVYSIV